MYRYQTPDPPIIYQYQLISREAQDGLVWAHPRFQKETTNLASQG